MRRRDLLGGLATGLGLLAGCTGSPGAGDGEPSPTGEPDRTPTTTPTPVVDGTPTREETPPTDTRDPTTPSGSPADPGETPVDPYAAFPEGPKEPPEKPAELTLESVREYVHTFEYRYVYNAMWFGESTEVHNECEVRSAREVESGYRVVVSCTAYSNTGGESRENGTGTSTVMHADYFTQTFVYHVTEDAVSRRRYEGESDDRTATPPPDSTPSPPPTPTRTPREVDG